MTKKYSSIFNDVLGPAMTGPSSSHTAGPARIGKIGHDLMGQQIKEIEIIVDENGSYPATFIGQCSDKGFIGGLLGYDSFDTRVKDALDIAKKNNIKVKFSKADLNATHPNTALIKLVGIDDTEFSMITHSTGGGMFEIVSVENFEISICGDYNELLILIDDRYTDIQEFEDIIKGIKNEYKLIKTTIENRSLYQIKSVDVIKNQFILKLKSIKGVIWIRKANKILPVASRFNYNIPFTTAKEALIYAEKNNMNLGDLAVKYEIERSGLTEDEVLNKMEELIRIMKHAALDSIAGNTFKRGFLSPKASIMDKNIKTKKLINVGILNKVMLWATAIMEYDNSMGVVVAAPTAGSCGVLPASLVAVGEDQGLSNREIARAMLVAGMVGVFISNQATFAAEVCACQAENGSASAMAAAGVVQMLGGSVKEGFDAAGLALQNLLGLVCDPIAGLVDIPCINRNTVAATNAIMSANMVLSGFDPVIPLDEVILSMWEVGNMLPKELKCTGLGGLCTTKTGLEITKEVELKRKSL